LLLLLSYASRKARSATEHSFISRVKTEDAIIQFVDETGLHNVGHHLSVTAGTQL